MVRLESIRDCLEGVVPGNIATCAPDGTPNVAYLSQVQFVDSEHVALSYQFFNTTRRNILASPYARVSVIDPHTAAHYRLSLQYLRTEDSGPLFETMKVRLAGIASHTGMSGVFRLLGSDVYRVLDIEKVPGEVVVLPPVHRNRLSSLRACSEMLCGAADLEGLLSRLLAGLARHFDIEHAMVLMLDEGGGHLYTVASRGYPSSGVGSEIALGDGIIGVAARERTPIRIGHFAAEYSYGRAIRSGLEKSGVRGIETEIPLPGLPASCSQLAVPIMACHMLVGMLYVESAQELRFGYDDEDALVALAGPSPSPARGRAVTVRHYAENDSVFLDGGYLIKGVAGSIFLALVRDYVDKGQTDFSNRELRLDPRIRLPEISDNLEARLILLARRLVEREAPVQIEKTGRGRLRLRVQRPLSLVQA